MNRIRAARQARGWTQNELAEKAQRIVTFKDGLIQSDRSLVA